MKRFPSNCLVRLAVVFAAASTLSSSLLAQDPPAPPGGFPVKEVLDRVITWSDTYRTKMDVYHPDGAPPATGWPGVKVMHGSGGTRKLPDVKSVARYLASAGYTVYAFDGRGNGDTVALNPGWTAPRTQERALLDGAESHGQAQGLVPGYIDGRRLAETGFSGGGNASVQAAAYSGKLLPLAGAVTHYPQIAAVVPEIGSIDSGPNAAFGGTLALDSRVQNLPPTDPVVLALRAGNYASYTSLVSTQFNTDMVRELDASTVPILAMWAAQDFKILNNVAIDRLLSGPNGAPRRMFLSTGGHSTVKNAHERLVMQDLRRRWFDRFLKNVRNGIEREPFAEIGMQPPSDAMHSDAQSIWEHRTQTQWPPAGPMLRMYLRGGQRLDPAAPTTVESIPTIQHRVTPGYDIVQYIANNGGLNPSSVLQNIPKSGVSFEGAPLNQDMELVGRVKVSVVADATVGLIQLTAVLKHVSPTGRATWITAGTAGVRPRSRGRHAITIEMMDVGHVVPAGHRLRVELINVADIDGPGSRRIRIVPYLISNDITVVSEPTSSSFVELPMRPYRSNLSPRLGHASAAAGIDHTMELRGGRARAGQPYAVYISGSGEGPGFQFGGLHIPLNVDAFTTIGASLINSPVFPGFAGVLDGSGRARPRIVVPAGPVASALVGLRLTLVAGVVNGGTLASVGGPVSLVIDP